MQKLYLSAALILLVSGCSKQPVRVAKLSPEQLAWQPYRTGDVLRFGQARSNKVRTFVVEEVQDRLEQYTIGGNAPALLGSPLRVQVQSIDVRVRRTDTLRYMLSPTSTPSRPDSIPDVYARSLLTMTADDGAQGSYAYVDWDFGFSSSLPLNEVLAGRLLPDTTQRLYPTLLATLRLGGIDYGSVLRVPNAWTALPAGYPRNKPAQLVYYAKGFGVVGFIEGSTLWYRLP